MNISNKFGLACGLSLLVLLQPLAAVAEIRPPVPKSRPAPSYPYDMRRKKIAGSVLVEFVIGTDGRVVAAQVLRSSHPGFESSALATIWKWRFEPGWKDGKPVAVRAQQALDFNIPVRRFVPPFELIRKGGKGTATIAYWLNQEQRVIRSEVEKASDPVFGKAALAMVADEFAHGPRMVSVLNNGRYQTEYHFGGLDRVMDASSLEILKLLKKPDARFTKESDLDAPLVVIQQDAALYPVSLQTAAPVTGQAVVEYFVDRTGVVQLPRVISATHEDFGYAAAQAVGQWQFEPPQREGKPTLVRVQTTVDFKPD
jgi:TonB family protein